MFFFCARCAMPKGNRQRIRRGKQTVNFTVLPNALLTDQNLTYKARGLAAYLLSRPEDWCVLISDLSSGLDRDTAVLSGLKELRGLGYISLVAIRSADGRC